MFDKNADETISWISEKEAEISTDELGQDLETIQSLLERQQGFQRDLAAIQQQVIFDFGIAQVIVPEFIWFSIAT